MLLATLFVYGEYVSYTRVCMRVYGFLYVMCVCLCVCVCMRVYGCLYAMCVCLCVCVCVRARARLIQKPCPVGVHSLNFHVIFMNIYCDDTNFFV
jgi:hypothetical protein